MCVGYLLDVSQRQRDPMNAERTPTYWCANFDYAKVLTYGLRIDAWLLQYQYEHDGFEYQGNRRQKGRTSAALRSLCSVEIDDWIIAYLAPSTFFAMGRIIEPRGREWQAGAVEHVDTVERTVRERCHLHFDGVVKYRDAPAFYEDFADHWSLPVQERGHGEPVAWPYPQRIDVEEWQHVVPQGVTVSGLAVAAPLPLYRKPLFPVDAVFFAAVQDTLRRVCEQT